MSDETKLEFFKLKEYFCPIHGDMGTRHITVNDGKVERRFCLQCFRQMLEDKCCELEEIKVKDEKTQSVVGDKDHWINRMDEDE